ncbi:MAG: hypothetical protein RH942_17275 [Kiloniellaceae bacterium]
MRYLRSFLFAALLALPVSAAAAPLDEVKESFSAYKSAILTSDGAAAKRLVTQESKDYFRGLADHALTLDRAGLQKIHLSDRLYAMLLRHNLDRARLENMTGGDVVAYAVEQGWIGREGAEQLELGAYKLDGDSASGTILQPDGQESTFKMEFTKVGGRWLLELDELMMLTRIAFEYSAKQTGLSDDDFVLLMLEYGSGRKPEPDIWSPP